MGALSGSGEHTLSPDISRTSLMRVLEE